MRPQALATALGAPERAFELRSVPASGDCFYDAMHLSLPASGRPEVLADAGAMRDTVAESITEEILGLMRMYAEAGVEGYEWHHRAPVTLEEVRTFAKRRGREAGAGQCVWADEHALQVIASLADVRILIYDEQAQARGSRSGRARGESSGAADSRFVSVGDQSAGRVVMLHRSRRQHFSPIFLDSKGNLEVGELPPATRVRWPGLGGAGAQAAVGAPPASGGDAQKKRKRPSSDAADST
jgi:hypothetical protein